MTVQQQYGSLLYQALAEPIGILLKTSDPLRARQALYRARADAKDEALAVLQIRSSPFPDGDLLICKSGPLAMTKP